MASNFRISNKRDRRALYLSLRGDFDGTSAYELIHSIREQGTGVSEVYIDTCGLNLIHPFGRDTLRSNLSLLKGKDLKLEFIGPNAAQLAPENRAIPIRVKYRVA